jgi:hypothetical protein
LASISGALILALGYPRPSIMQPLWKFGQYLLLFGLINSAIYLSLFIQMRKILASDPQ